MATALKKAYVTNMGFKTTNALAVAVSDSNSLTCRETTDANMTDVVR